MVRILILFILLKYYNFNEFNLFNMSKNKGAKVEIKHQKELMSFPSVLNLLIINVTNVKAKTAIPFSLFFKNKHGKNKNMT